MSEVILPGVLIIGAAVIGDLIVEQMKAGKEVLLVNWFGAWAGATAALILVAPWSVGGLFFWVDPWLALVQGLLVAGIIGALVDIPFVVRRNWLRRKSVGGTAREIIFLVSVGGLLVVLIVVFRMNYQPVVLPI
jgi:hypothetical protein